MLGQGWILLCVLVAAWALNPVAHRTSEESLRSALDAVARKQRSLDPASQDYYNELHAFKYHGGDPERKFERDDHEDRQVDEEDEEIEFLPSETGQLETVGNGFQGLNNKLLERALMDYAEGVPEQGEPVQSMFRERERSSNSRKRGGSSSPDRLGIESKELAKLVLEELQDGGSPYGPADISDDEYLNTSQMLYEKYGSGQGNKLYENSEGPMSWGELANKEAVLRGQAREAAENEYIDRDQDQSVLYLSPAERRNVNGRYPIGRDLRNYRNLMKRYPVAKRSAKPHLSKNEITDPKVAHDLSALFGSQTTETPNDTHVQNHEHDHNHDHDHDHDHDHNHEHDHDHNHTHDHTERNRETTSEAPKVTSPSKGQKENMSKETDSKSIVVRKKSIDWSQYFGIDRRKKKATFKPRQGSQNQDDLWLVQRYYENMAENLRPHERFEKLLNMRKALLELKNKFVALTADMEARNQKAPHLQKNGSSNLEEELDELVSKGVALMAHMKELRPEELHLQNHGTDDKRCRNGKEEESENPKICPELDAIEKGCKAEDNLPGDGTEMLYYPCVTLQICRACVEDDADLEEGMEGGCLAGFMSVARKVCEAEKLRKGIKGRQDCVTAAVILSQLQPPKAVVRECYMNENSCLRHYYYPYRH